MTKNIKAEEALALMADASGKSANAISRELGRHRSWLSTLRGREPMLGTVALVASVTAHDVAIIDHKTGEIVATIAPPPKDEHRR